MTSPEARATQNSGALKPGRRQHSFKKKNTISCLVSPGLIVLVTSNSSHRDSANPEQRVAGSQGGCGRPHVEEPGTPAGVQRSGCHVHSHKAAPASADSSSLLMQAPGGSRWLKLSHFLASTLVVVGIWRCERVGERFLCIPVFLFLSAFQINTF